MPASIIRSMALTLKKKLAVENGSKIEVEKELAEVFSGRTEILCIHQHESTNAMSPITAGRNPANVSVTGRLSW